MLARSWSPLTFTLLWLLLVVVAVVTRPPLPVDETRYLAVAWEMWLRGDFIVPHLNGETYSHKPPLLFWAMQLGWALFGVNDWWPPLVAPLFGLASLFMVRKIAQRLWPDDKMVADLAPLVLLGAAFWTLYTTVTMFDMLVAACTLFGLLGILSVWRDGGIKGWIWLGIAIGLGVWAKGPVILLQTLPLALFAPLWDSQKTIKQRDGGWKKWYVGTFCAVLLGAAIGLSWAIPAGIMGGEEYRNAIFWGQTAGRVVKAFDHARPWWWYLAVIGPLLLPWIIWPTLWRSFKVGGKGLLTDPAVRFCLVWFVPIFFAFSLISGKQLHYLLPIFPAFALLLAHFLSAGHVTDSRLARLLPAGFFVILGLAVMAVPYVGLKKIPDWVADLPLYWMILPVTIAVFLLVRPLKSEKQIALGFTSLSVAFVVALHLCLAPYLSKAFDLHDVSDRIKVWQDEGYEVGYMGTYHGMFQFLGHLEKPITELSTNEGVNQVEWGNKHPKAKIILVRKKLDGIDDAIDYRKIFRGRTIYVVDVQRLNGRYDDLD